MKNWKIEGAVDAKGAAVTIFIEDGILVEKLSTSDYEVINAQGLSVLPGFVDLHTHVREPGR